MDLKNCRDGQEGIEMKIYRIAGKEYTDIGHKELKSIISIWQMQKDGTISEKIITMPMGDDRHPIIFGPDTSKIIAEGRCDIGKKECSCYYMDQFETDDKKRWIKFLLKEKFGQDTRIYEF